MIEQQEIQAEGRLRLLPRQIYPIANIIGDDAAMEICRKLDGVVLTLPFSDEHDGDMDTCRGLPHIIGCDNFKALIRVYGGRSFRIPGENQGLVYDYAGPLPDFPDDDRTDWPGTLRAISRRIGGRKAYILAKTHGHDGLCVPKFPTPAHRIVRSVGGLAAAILAREYGGQRLELSILHHGPLKKNLVFDLRDQGLSRSEIARQAGVTCRYVRMLLNSG